MKEKLILSIPVYSIKEKLFYKKWDEKYTKEIERYDYRGNQDDFRKNLKNMYYPTNNWKYNKIIGYIEIKVSSTDIIFEIYRCMKKKFVFSSGNKDFLEYFPSLGNHFYIGKKTDKELKIEIEKILKYIEKEDFKGIRNLYVDYSIYNNFIKYFDLTTFIEKEFAISKSLYLDTKDSVI